MRPMIRSNIAWGGLLALLCGFACNSATLKRLAPEAGAVPVNQDAGGDPGGVPQDAVGLQLPEAGLVVTPVDAAPACVNLRCQQRTCVGSASTTVSGTV